MRLKCCQSVTKTDGSVTRQTGWILSVENEDGSQLEGGRVTYWFRPGVPALVVRFIVKRLLSATITTTGA